MVNLFFFLNHELSLFLFFNNRIKAKHRGDDQKIEERWQIPCASQLESDWVSGSVSGTQICHRCRINHFSCLGSRSRHEQEKVVCPSNSNLIRVLSLYALATISPSRLIQHTPELEGTPWRPCLANGFHGSLLHFFSVLSILIVRAISCIILKDVSFLRGQDRYQSLATYTKSPVTCHTAALLFSPRPSALS